MKKQTFQITPKMVLYVAVMVGIGLILGLAGYFLTTKPYKARAPVVITGIELKNEEKEKAESVLKGYLEELRTKSVKELASYFTSDALIKNESLSGYYDDRNVGLDSFEILKAEKLGNEQFGFVVREFQKDVKYGVVGYVENRYELSKTEDSYLLGPIVLGEYVDTGETKDWKLVSDPAKGYEIKYPENFFYQEPEITVSTMAGSSSLEGCYARNFKGFIVRKVEIAGRSYCLSESTEATAEGTYVDSSYTNVEKNRIATLHFIVRYPDCGALGVATDAAFINCDENNKKGPGIVERVVSTFKIMEAG
ncbi:MAG: hypothetical protein WC788_02660 [Candidatus Paceibacterota bacterium]|jgi:hypothetical protein